MNRRLKAINSKASIGWLKTEDLLNSVGPQNITDIELVDWKQAISKRTTPRIILCTWRLQLTRSVSPEAVPIAPFVSIVMAKLVRIFRVGVHQWTGCTAFSLVFATVHLTFNLDGNARPCPHLTFWHRNNGREELDKHDEYQKIHRLGNLLIYVCNRSNCLIFSSAFPYLYKFFEHHLTFTPTFIDF